MIKYLFIFLTILVFISCAEDEKKCKKGFKLDGKECVNIDECSDSELNNCSIKANCIDTEGSFSCTCKDGYSGDGYAGPNHIGCDNINECLGNVCGENSNCIDTEGSYNCICNENFHNLDNDFSNGCEYACTVNTDTPICGADNNCDGNKTEKSVDACGEDAVCIDSKCVLGNLDNIIAGKNHFCAKKGSKLFCWGKNNKGQVNNIPGNDILEPVEVDLDTISGKDVTDIKHLALGDEFSCAVVRAIGKDILVCWGEILTNENIVLTTGADITSLKAGANHVCFLKAFAGNTRVTCFGKNNKGQLGRGDNKPTSLQSVVPNVGNVIDLSIGSDHTCVIEESDHVVKCWGDNHFGQLKELPANATEVDKTINVATIITDENGLDYHAENLSLGAFHSCSISNDRIKCWGYSGVKQIGSERSYSNPTSLLNESDELYSTPLFMNNGSLSSVTCIKKNETTSIECRGANSNKQINKNGLDTVANYSFKTELDANMEKAISNTKSSTCVLINIKSVLGSENDVNVLKCKGGNESGELGVNSTNASSSFKYVEFSSVE